LLSNDDHGGHVHVDLETLATALYVRIDDELKACPDLRPARPATGFTPVLSDAELITIALVREVVVPRVHELQTVGTE
jgi:hypothetical protein